MESISEEMELGRGIEQLIQTAVAINFSLENYMGKTNPGFYRMIFDSFYPNLEETLGKVRQAYENGDKLAQDIECLKYHDCINKAKNLSIKAYLEKCCDIAKKQNIAFDPFKKYKEIENDTDAILKIMNEIRSLEEQSYK